MTRPKVFIYQPACPKALVDLEKLAFALQDQNFELTKQAEGADIVVVFGCAFIDDAKRESIETILDAAELKKNGLVRKLAVVGCLPQKYAMELERSLPEVDFFVGTSKLPDLPAILRAPQEDRRQDKVFISSRFLGWDRSCGRIPVDKKAWTRTVMICDGCDNNCTYCSIPQMRGRLRSRHRDEIVDEVRELARQGVQEIILAGQDTASYGKDIGGIRLSGLLEHLSTHTDIPWIRLCYASIDNVDDSLADVIAEHTNICKYLDIPIQHASPKILRLMGRRDRPEENQAKIDHLRQTVPEIALRTSVIVGFPGETEKDFEELVNFLKRSQFDIVGVFAFSPQPGTPASTMSNQVPDYIKQERLIEIVAIQEEISRIRASELLGKLTDLLVDESHPDYFIGHTQYDAPEVDRVVRVKGSGDPGKFVKVRIESFLRHYEFEGTAIASR